MAAPTYVDISGSAVGTTSLTIAYPTTIEAGDLLVMVVSYKYGGTASVATPSGWTAPANNAAQGGSGTGVDSGIGAVIVFHKTADGTESGNVTVTVTSGNAAVGRILVYRSTIAPLLWDVACVTANDATAGTSWSAAAAADYGVDGSFSELVLACTGVNSNAYNYTAQAITQAGVTFGTMAERVDTSTSSGDDCGLIVSEHPVASGTSAGNPTFTMTASGSSASSPVGGTVMLRMRALNNGDDINLLHTEVAVATQAGNPIVRLGHLEVVSAMQGGEPEVLLHGMEVAVATAPTGIVYVGSSNYQSSSNPASVAIPKPTGAQTGDLVVVAFAAKEASYSFTTPTGWTLLGTSEDGQGANGASSGGTTRAWIFYRVLDGTESWNVSFAGSGTATVIGQAYAYRSVAGLNLGARGYAGGDGTAGTDWSVTTDPLLTETGNRIFAVSANNHTDQLFSAQAVAQAGATFETAVELSSVELLEFALWGDTYRVTFLTSDHKVVTGASGAITYTMTASGTTGDTPAGATVLAVIYEGTPQTITGASSLDFGMGITAGDGELTQGLQLEGVDGLDFGTALGTGTMLMYLVGGGELEFGMAPNPSGAVQAAVANDSVLYRLDPNAPGPGKISERPLWRHVDRIPTPYTIVVSDGVARRVQYPSSDLDPDTVYLGGHVYEILDTHPHYAALVAAGIAMEEIG